MENVFSNNALIMVSILLLIALIALVSLVVYMMILAVAVIIMQFVFCLDIIFAVLYYAKLKKQIRKMKKSCESSQLFRF